MKFKILANGTKVYSDHREKCTPAEEKRRKDLMLGRGDSCMAKCGRPFDDYSEVELGHRESKGMNGSKHDTRWANIGLIHRDENREQGSRSLDDYLADPKRIGVANAE